VVPVDSGQYKNGTRMAPAGFELMINLIAPKIVARDTRFRAVILVHQTDRQ
jgi:hypothetical protein